MHDRIGAGTAGHSIQPPVELCYLTIMNQPGSVAPGEPLTLRRGAIDTYRENGAYLQRDCAVYRAEGFQALAKVEVCADGTHILAVLNVVDDDCIVTATELGLSEQAYAQLGLAAGAAVRVDHADPPHSMAAVRRTMQGA